MPRSKPRQLALFPDVAGPTLRDIADAVKVAGIDSLAEARERADHARYQEVDVRSAVNRARGMPFNWALNPYRGCTHACEYCYARKYQRHLELGAGDEFSTFILVKRNLPEVLRREINRPSWEGESVAIGTATDPYQPIEGHYRITRRCLEVLSEAKNPFSIVTKGPMVLRDRDILAGASARARCQVFMSVPSVDEDAWAALEPGTAPPRQRLRAIRELSEAGIETGVLMMPLVPGLTTSRSSIERTVSAIADAGVRLVGANVARLDPGVREHFFAFLSQRYPELLAGYERLYPGTNASSDYTREVKQVVSAAAEKAGVWRARNDHAETQRR